MTGQIGLQYALRRVHDGENDAAKDLLEMAARHRSDHEVHHVCRDLADWSRSHVAQLAEIASQYGLDLQDRADEPGALQHARESLSSLIGRRREPGLLLLEDLRELYLLASANSLAWEMLAQHAQARQERDILDLTARCHPQTLRQIRWANTMLKTLSPQVLAVLDTA